MRLKGQKLKHNQKLKHKKGHLFRDGLFGGYILKN